MFIRFIKVSLIQTISLHINEKVFMKTELHFEEMLQSFYLVDK